MFIDLRPSNGLLRFGERHDPPPPPRLHFGAKAEGARFLRDLAGSDEWKRLSVRDPSKPVTDASYLNALHRSTVEVFEQWWLQGSTAQFTDMLRDQHLALTAPGAQGGYGGASDAAMYAYPGQLRGEARRADVGSFTIGVTAHLKGTPPPSVALAIARSIEAWAAYRADTSGTTPWPTGVRQEVALDDIPAGARPVLTVNQDKIEIGYPPHGKLGLYLDAMAMRLERVRSAPAPTREWLADLARYLQLGAAAHPFYRVNFSLIMSHVNYALMAHGLRGISHDQLDYFGAVSSTAELVAELERAVRAANPGWQPAVGATSTATGDPLAVALEGNEHARAAASTVAQQAFTAADQRSIGATTVLGSRLHLRR